MAFTNQRFVWEVFLPALFKLIAGLGIIPGTAAAFWLRNLYQKRRQNKAIEGWSSTEARIHSWSTRHEGKKLWLEVTYSYFVDEYRSGSYVRRVQSSDEAGELVRRIGDRRVQVHYDPSDPDKSVVLDRGFEMVALLAPQLG